MVAGGRVGGGDGAGESRPPGGGEEVEDLRPGEGGERGEAGGDEEEEAPLLVGRERSGDLSLVGLSVGEQGLERELLVGEGVGLPREGLSGSLRFRGFRSSFFTTESVLRELLTAPLSFSSSNR